MRYIIDRKLASVKKSLNDAYNQCDNLGVIHYESQEQLLLELLQEYILEEQHYSSNIDHYCDYDDDFCDYHNDEESRYYDDLDYYKQQEIDDMYKMNNHYSWWIGKNVLHTDSMWFTSDEIEAFRVIWQRRISAV
jgi:hypothetical protein